MDNDVDFFYKLDIFNFEYSEDRGELGNYTVGKSISNDEERYIASVSINPKRSEEISIFQELIHLQGSVHGKTVGMDYRLLNHDVIDILKKAYGYGLILGIRLLPNGAKLSKELYDQFNIPDFQNFVISADEVDSYCDLNHSSFDLRVLNDLYEIEHVQYEKNDQDYDHYNIHIHKKLDSLELEQVLESIKTKKCNQIYLDYYDPSYYQEFLNVLKDKQIPNDITIVFLGNPLYDEVHCFEDFSKIVSNPIRIRYNTCHDLNEFYREGPYTEGVQYYSDIEVSGEVSYEQYYELTKFIDDVVSHMEREHYSPLEKVAYVDDLIKSKFQSAMIQEDIGTMLHTIYQSDSVQMDELADLYSSILRRSGVSCFTYSTDSFRKNMIRIKDDKYGIDQIALMDVVNDFEVADKKNSFDGFLVPIDNDIYNQETEIISIPTSLCMSSSDYYAYVNDSNPSDPISLGVRMLQLMGLGHGYEGFDSKEEEIEFYKSALANSKYMEEIPFEKIAHAFQEVRRNENKYSSLDEENEDYNEIYKSLQTRGNDYYISPSIKLIGPPEKTVDVDLYKLYSSSIFDTKFVEKDVSSIYGPRRIGERETIEEYKKYLEKYYQEQFYKKNNKSEGMNKMKDLDEYVIDEINVNELVFYRDINDSGRLFANKSVFDRFHIEPPKYVIEMDNGENIYEMNTSDAIDIINASNNKYSPFIVRYRYIELNENEDVYGEDSHSNMDKFIFYRNINDPEKLYVRKEVFDRFHISTSGEPVYINGVACYEMEEKHVLYITGNAKNNYSPYEVEERGIPLDRKKGETIQSPQLPIREKFVIYRNVDYPSLLYVRKEMFTRFGLHNDDVEEVNISGIPCYVIDRGDLAYIVGNANNDYSPYDIEYRDVKVKAFNIKAAENEKAIDEFKIYRNANNPNKLYVRKEVLERFHLNLEVEEVIISGVPCYVIDEEDLAYIVGNANNKYAPYKVSFVDVELDSKNMKPGYNKNAVNTITLYRNINDPDMFFVRKDVFERFHLETEVEEVLINREPYYVIDPSDLEYIVGNANNKYSPYRLEFKDIPLGRVPKKVTAKELVDEDYVPGTNVKKPRSRMAGETDEEYIEYLENYYNDVFGQRQTFRR